MQLYVYVTIVFITSSCDAFLLLQDFFFFCFPCVWLFFNWRKIALQCCVGFCPTTMQTDHNYMYISLPSVSASRIPRIPALWVVTERRALLHSRFPLFTHGSVYRSMRVSPFVLLSRGLDLFYLFFSF